MSKRGKAKPIEFIDETIERWDRQPGEGESAWRAFTVYRDQGLGNRSQRKACEQLFPHRDPTDARTREIGGWSIKWRWVERCAAWDAHLESLRQEEFREALRRDTELNIATYRAMRNKASRAIALVGADNVHVRDAVRMVDVAITGLRREAGLATEITTTEKDDAFVAWLTAGDEEEGER